MAVWRYSPPSSTGVRGRQPVPALDVFRQENAEWFERTFDLGLTPAQEPGWLQDASGAHTLIQAPTLGQVAGSVPLRAADRLIEDSGEGTRPVYVSPLKALNYDIERNLRGPLAGLQADVNVAVRTGDTSQKERAAMLRRPPDLLITTPESLYLMLTSRARETLTGVRTLILDEVHAVAGHQARRPPRALRRAPRAPDRRAVPADRPRRRSVRWRRSASSSPAGGRSSLVDAGRSKAPRRGRRPARGHARAGRERGDHRPARHRRRVARPVDLAVDLPAPAGAGGGAPLDDRLRQQPPARGAARAAAQRAGWRRDRASHHLAPLPASSGSKSRSC